MEIYSIPLALEDFLPVIFSAIALFILAKMIIKMDDGLSHMAYAGVVLVTLGGLSKATWKLIIALSDAEINIHILDNALFFGLSTGFILIAYALWYAQRKYFERRRPDNVWFFPIVVCVVTLGTAFYTATLYDPERASPQIWFLILLGMTTIFNFITIGLAIRQARHQNQTTATLLLIINLVAIIALQGIARIGDDTETGQWIAQITNTINQLILLYGVWLLYKGVQDHVAVARSELHQLDYANEPHDMLIKNS
ncbi:MAG: hypothetical protein AAF846_10395 [Chloroflexota bacterium]